MSIKSFVQNEILLSRLRQSGVLVVYDPSRRYRELCLELTAADRRVIDASESSIESRGAALAALQELGRPNTALKELLVYVPAKAPVTDEDRQRDPFALYAACGAIFPEGDGDEYQSLCLKHQADHATEIRRIFGDNPNPSFDVIDAVGGGAGWPHLQALLHVDSARDILFALLVPTDTQKAALKAQEAWLPEAKALFQSALGLNLLTRSKSWGPVADELWRFLLFSEFAFDLPVALPATLAEVPRARPEAQLLVDDLCDRLRNDQRTQVRYIERAEAIEKELNLPAACRAISDLGVRDTFPFEERSFFDRAVDALKRDNVDQLRQTLARRAVSVWIGRGENRVRWNLLDAAVSLVQACDDADRQLPKNTGSQDGLLDFYLSSLREVDRRQRELEQAAGDALIADGQMADVLRLARTTYRKLADKVQGVFIRHLEKSGWPPVGRLANADVFDKLVAPKLAESGRRVALLLIDALRYELGIELQKQLHEAGQVELQAAFAQLPSITPVGMASLLPGAGASLKLIRNDDGLQILLGEQPLTNVTQRMAVLRQRYGQRFAEATVRDLLSSAFTLPVGAELLVLRSNDMDNDFEANPEAAPGLINRALQQIRAALHKLADLGFADAVIATDHGFYLNTATEAGDVCAKPTGNWLNVHNRLLLGDGVADPANFVASAASLGIRGDYNQAAGPRALVAYASGASYCHGGASLQEAVVPVLTVRLRVAEEPTTAPPTVKLSYTRASRRITTRVPVVDVAVGGGDLFSVDATVTILIEAHDKAGNVVGEASPGGAVNPATLTLSLQPATSARVTLRMNSDFEGKFTVKALDPVTLTVYDKLDLETDYTV